MKEPPGRSPFSRRVTLAPSSTARRAAVSPASPPPATMTCTTAALGQGEVGLMLHVLYAHVLGAADEDRQGIGAFDEVLDLEPLLLGFLAVILRGSNEAAKVVEHLLCFFLQGGGDEVQPILSGPYDHIVLSRREAHLHEVVRRPLWVVGTQDESFEVVVRKFSLSGNQRERETLRSGEEISLFPRFDLGFSRKLRRGG